MANRRVLVKRRNSTRNIRKITRTMQLIATARFQAAYNRATAGKPYTEKLAQLVAGLARAADGIDHPLMQVHEGVATEAMLILSSDRGLCGGYNSNVLRAAMEHLDARSAAGISAAVTMVGGKGIASFAFRGRAVAEELTGIGDAPRFDQVEPIANRLMEAYVAGEIGALHVAYMKFHSPGKQSPVVERILPLAYDSQAGDAAEAGGAGAVEYEFSPSPTELLDELLPATVQVRIFQAFIDAAVSEQVARMVAMKAATDAAEDMIKRLTMQYNRARQTQVTMELLDIVGGANALG
jgi:F-type H+-transporting ATPase subunit gamma